MATFDHNTTAIPRKPLPGDADAGHSKRLSVRELAKKIASRGGNGGGSDGGQTARDADDIAPALALSSLDLNSDSRSSDSGDIPRSSLDKPLPEIPSQSRDDVDNDHSRYPTARQSPGSGERIPHYSDVLDLTNTEDTEVKQQWAPAVTHETIFEEIHEVREESITREIHDHDVHHRILPIKETEVLPARHYVVENGSLKEVSPQQLPGRDVVYTQRPLEEVFKETLPQEKNSDASGARVFSARNFNGKEGSYTERHAPGGHTITERTWVHPPTLAQNPDAVPFHFGSTDPKDDGFR